MSDAVRVVCVMYVVCRADVAAVKLENKGDLEMFYSEQQVCQLFDVTLFGITMKLTLILIHRHMFGALTLCVGLLLFVLVLCYHVGVKRLCALA